MKKSILLFLTFFILKSNSTTAQNTVGLISYDQTRSFDGYNLIYPHNQPNVFLLNNCGEIVHTWEDEANFRPGNTAYLTADGLLYKTKRDASVTADAIWAGGGGAILEIRNWDNDLVWSYTMNDENNRLHHDFAVKPNGNIIALAWELKNTEECLEAGRDTSTLAQGKMWPDWVFEINPNTDEIVWEWHAWDHLIQDFDATKANFGVIADHPELIDVNYGRADGHPDWMHGNALDYNSNLDQIMLSIPYFDEVWIIDRTTTTETAASHSGGLSGRGGDLMFRWGNPRTYENGDSTNQQLFFQHDTHWIDDFLDASHPQFGKVAVFNNRVGEDFSTANVLTPAWDMYSWSFSMENDVFLPTDFDITITHPTSQSLYSTGLSSVQFLPNGNTLLTSGRRGYSFELTPNNEIVWEFITPRNGTQPATQGDTLDINNNLTFRMTRYPADFQAFEGKDLSRKGWMELEPDSTFCETLTPLEELMEHSKIRIFPNPTSDFLTIEWEDMFYADIEVFNFLGKKIEQYRCSGGRKYLNTSNWESGIYVVTIDGRYSKKVVVQR